MDPVRSTASTIAIVCAIVSFVLSGEHHIVWGFVAAIVAMLSGLWGFLRSISPRVSGGIISIVSVILGAVALLFALIRAIV
jgi:hypothetical protein